MPIKNLWLNTKLECLETFLERAFKVDDYYSRAVIPPESGGDVEHYAKTLGELEDAVGILLEYQDVVYRAVYLELNGLVERELKYLAASIVKAKGDDPGRLNRGSAQAAIEREYGISLGDLARYEEIEEIRRIANAYKHDDGFSGIYEETITYEGTVLVSEELRYQLSWDTAKQSIQTVREFLHALPGDRQPYPEGRTRLADGRTIRVP
jgi:hypothetical protein